MGANTRIWHWTHVCGGAQIGEGCSLGQNVFVSARAVIGNNVKIQNNVSIYDGVVLNDNVFCGPSVVFTYVIDPRSAVSRRHEYKRTLVCEGATLGANCTVLCGISIGQYSFIGAGSVVTSDVIPFSLVIGVPARHVGWISAYGEKIPLPLQGNAHWRCTHTGDFYELRDSRLFRNCTHLSQSCSL